MAAFATDARPSKRARVATSTASDSESTSGSVASEPTAKRAKRVAFAGSEYIEYDLAAAPVVRLCGVQGLRGDRNAEDMALELKARNTSEEEEENTSAATTENSGEVDAADLRQKLESEYAREMREAIEERGLPCIDTSVVDLRVQHKLSEVLVAWSVIVGDSEHKAVDGEDADDARSGDIRTSDNELFDASASLDIQRKRLELCRKQVFGPVVDGYTFGRRFFSVESFLLTLEFEEMVELANSHGIEVPDLPVETIRGIKVADRELIATYSPTGLGKPLKMLTFRELVEEAYARGILMDDERDAAQKKSKRAWVDALRPVLHSEMVTFKIREAHTELLHAHLATELETKMRSSRTATIVRLLRSHLATAPAEESEDLAAMHRYFRAVVDWHEQKTRTPSRFPTLDLPKEVADQPPVHAPPSPEV